MKYVCLMKQHVACTIFCVFFCVQKLSDFFLHSLSESVNAGDFRYCVALLNLCRTLTVIFLSEELHFFLSRFQWPNNKSNCYFCLFHFSTTTNDCYSSQKTLKGIFKVNLLYMIYCFYLWTSHHRETFFLLNFNSFKEEKCLL